jgi:small subunit ribosomal protein S16
MGKIRNPQYRIVVADSRTKRDGKAIEFIGIYHPKEDPSLIEVKSDRVQYWLGVGAQPSEPVKAILTKTGDWQKFKGLPAPTEPLKVAPARANRTALYEAAAQAAAGIEKPADKPAAKKAAKKAEEPKPEEAKAEEVKAEEVKAEEVKAEEPKAEEPKAEEVKAEEPKAEEVKAEEPKAEAAEETAVAAADEQQG